MFCDFRKAFGLDPEYNKQLEESMQEAEKKALKEKWCCTCEHYIPVDPNLPGFVVAYPECEKGRDPMQSCEEYRRKGYAIRNSSWADRIREIYEKGVEMALVTICVTAIGTLIIERVARKIYSEIKERYEARIEDRKNGFAYGKYLDNIAYAYGMKRKFFESDKEFRARILEQIRGI